MSRQRQNAEDKSKDSEQAHLIEYSLDELLANCPKGAFQLDAEDKRWLEGSLMEKPNC